MPELTLEAARQRVSERILSPDLVQATLKRVEDDAGERRITIRPVEIRGATLLQFSVFDGRRTDTQNYPSEAAEAILAPLLTEGLRHAHVATTMEDTQLQISRKGKPVLHTKKRATALQPTLKHDRTIARALPEGEADDFLRTIGLMTADGRIKADRQRKYQQINEFIRLVTETADLSALSPDPLLIVDFGCGNAYLSFALHHYLNQRVQVAAELVGVDRNPELIATNQAKAAELGTGTIDFVASGIAEYQPSRPPEIVVALHACDTATDAALAQAIRAEAKLIFAAPCCHHHLQAQLDARLTEAPFSPLLRDGIVKERFGDLLTDTFRSLLLRLAGYRVDVIEFISPEHTAKNMMIRAVRVPQTERAKTLAEYRAMKETFGVTPYLESLIDASLIENSLN